MGDHADAGLLGEIEKELFVFCRQVAGDDPSAEGVVEVLDAGAGGEVTRRKPTPFRMGVPGVRLNY